MSPGLADPVIVRRHLLALDAAVTALRRHTGRPLEDLEASADERWIVERGLQLCAQNCIDIGTHLAASAGHDVADYASAIDALATMQVVPTAFARGFRGIAGFHNVLVHGYLAVDPAIVHRLLNQQLDDFVAFAAHVVAHLDRDGAGPAGG